MLSLLIILGPEREKGLLKKGLRLTMGKAFAINIYFYLRGRGAGRHRRQTNMCTDGHGDLKRVLEPLELDLKVVMKHPMQML